MVDLIEACYAYGSQNAPFVTPDGRRAIPQIGLQCLRHNQVFLPNSIPEARECPDCDRDRMLRGFRAQRIRKAAKAAA